MRRAGIVGVVLLLSVGPGWSAPAGLPSPRTGEAQPSWANGAQQPRSAPRLGGLEEAVDPLTYRLSAGDLLAVHIWGPVDVSHEIMVTADGRLLVPAIGEVEAAGAMLAEAAEALQRLAARSYPHSQITLSLLEPALLRIPITGQVAQPGSYEIRATLRLADLVFETGALGPGANTRAVVVENNDGSRAAYDLLAWQVDGRVAENPRLRSGDRVHVPPATEAFVVRGVLDLEAPSGAGSAVLDRPFASGSRRIPYKEGDRVDFALRAVGWPGSGFCESGVWLWRAHARRSWIPLPDASATSLAPGDALEIPFCREWISVSGEIRRPGYYPFLPGQTAADYVGLAGGPSSNGRGKGWKLLGDDGRPHDCAAADTVQAGARIWIPERRTTKIATFLAPVGTAAALIVSLIALTR